MSRYRIIRTIDILGDEEFLVHPEPDWQEIDHIPENIPFWFDSDSGWSWLDFSNPEIYASVEEIIVEF